MGSGNAQFKVKSDRGVGTLGTQYVRLASEVRAVLRDWVRKPVGSDADSGWLVLEKDWVSGHPVHTWRVGELVLGIEKTPHIWC